MIRSQDLAIPVQRMREANVAFLSKPAIFLTLGRRQRAASRYGVEKDWLPE